MFQDIRKQSNHETLIDGLAYSFASGCLEHLFKSTEKKKKKQLVHCSVFGAEPRAKTSVQFVFVSRLRLNIKYFNCNSDVLISEVALRVPLTFAQLYLLPSDCHPHN